METGSLPSMREEEMKETLSLAVEAEEEEEEEEVWPRKCGGVTLEGYVDGADGGEEGTGGVARTKSLTDEDLDELKGCLDLGFGFSYEEIPELCDTLPALELCYSMSQRFLDEQQQQQDRSSSAESMDLSAPPPSPPIANWRISGPGKTSFLGSLIQFPLLLIPGDDPDAVKARLKYWAQAVACTIKLCS
ncbi:unnamed protein product [Musa acuminata subsp. malaccensis]|uniref:(wild Malaysian banana) hypothetical protein n=1 Tax=Musa acuminata subsp. malaccensis TaxID=214687 RepID=A0A804L8Y5_MUSAM|nr:unnamed protein product [Musa acuminata subsp. malaccensis]